MEPISCIIIVGKPGAGKSTIGSLLSEMLNAHYTSLGSFMREELNIPDPHIGVDKRIVYSALHDRFSNQEGVKTLMLDCHPYPEDDFQALQEFIQRPSLNLWAVIHVDADDHIALERLERRPRPGQTYAERLKYYNDNSHFIERLLEHPNAIRAENNDQVVDLSNLNALAQNIYTTLLKYKNE